MQYYAPNRIYVFQKFSRVNTPGPTFCAGTPYANIFMKGKTCLHIFYINLCPAVGVKLDSTLAFAKHINDINKSCSFHTAPCVIFDYLCLATSPTRWPVECSVRGSGRSTTVTNCYMVRVM